MKVMVVGVLALASALAREPNEALRDWHVRGGEPQAILLPRPGEGDVGGAPTFSAARSRSRTSRGSSGWPKPRKGCARSEPQLGLL